MEDFFSPNGSRCLLFYYEETANSGMFFSKYTQYGSHVMNESLLMILGAKQGKPSRRLYLTDGTKEPFPGLGLFFIRVSNKPVTTANVAQEVYFGTLESNGGGLLEAVEMLLSNIFLPALKEQTSWGALSTDASGHALKEAFLTKLSLFISVLANARASIGDTVKLSPCTNPQLAALSSPTAIVGAAGNAELVAAAEASAQTWCKEIKQVGMGTSANIREIHAHMHTSDLDGV